MPILETPSDATSWHRDLFLRENLFPYQRRTLDWLTMSDNPMDSIRLRLPWGEDRNFLIPAADPYNPRFETIARGVQRQINDAFGVPRAALGPDRFCAVSVRDLWRKPNDGH